MLLLFTGKDAAGKLESWTLDAQNHTLPGVNIYSSGLQLPRTVSSLASSSVDADVSLIPSGAIGFQGSLYGCVGVAAESKTSGSPNSNPNI